MLKYVKIKNFLSFGDEATFSMEADLKKDRSFDHNFFAIGEHKLLKTAAVFGANSSGKTNLFKVLKFLRSLVLESHTYTSGQPIPGIKRFLLRNTNYQIPAEFEVSFVADGHNFKYILKLTEDSVVYEELTMLKGKTFIQLFEREQQTIKLYNGFDDKGMSDNVKENTLALSVYATRNSDIAKKISSFFLNTHVFIGGTTEQDSFDMLESDNKFKDFLLSILSDAGISDINFNTKETMLKELPQELRNALMTLKPSNISFGPEDMIKVNHIGFQHNVLDENYKVVDTITFGRNQESEGTGRLFDLIGSIYNVVHQGKILFIDEMDKSIHTGLMEKLIHSLHNAPDKFKFQIIFNTHNTNLLDIEGLFRKDQINLIEKDVQSFSTTITRLSDKKIRKDMVIEKNYLHGNLGARPKNLDEIKIAS